jgi:hypothetical protein
LFGKSSEAGGDCRLDLHFVGDAKHSPEKTPDAKFLSLNRWRKPSEMLFRNLMVSRGN